MLYPIEKVSMTRPYFHDRGALPINLVVIHYTAGREPGDLAVLRGATDRKVSAHYLVGRHESFGIKALVPENKVAWHAGKSEWTDHNGVMRRGVNAFSIGIEISNLGPPEAFTDFQYVAVAQIGRLLMSRYDLIKTDRFVGHNQISPGRKPDPGPLWDWNRYRQMLSESVKEIKVIRLDGNRLVDCHARIENGRTRVDLRPVSRAMGIDPPPAGDALAGCNPEIVPPGVTRIDLRPFCEKRGWDVLTHRLIEDGKIYLRPHDPVMDEDEDGAKG